jgi:hypothetical protein
VKRADRAAQRRRDWHEGRIEQARTLRQRFWAACGWLASEARHRGDHELDAATEMVLTRVHEIREGDGDDRDRH